jgi:predicted RNase H-like HicB family nuclease
MVVRLQVHLEEAPGRGWVAHVPEARATAQGETREAALANLRELLERYPEVLDELWADLRHRGPSLELVPA